MGGSSAEADRAADTARTAGAARAAVGAAGATRAAGDGGARTVASIPAGAAWGGLSIRSDAAAALPDTLRLG